MEINDLRNRVTRFCHRQTDHQQLPDWWRDPILVTAKADDRFSVLPEIAASNHLLPGELLRSSRTVVVYFIPFTPELANGNIKGKFASNEWGRSLALTNSLIQDIGNFIKTYFAGYGYDSKRMPATYNFDPESLTAKWSHKHLAHLSGLGRFGVNAQIITPLGSAGRLGSLVTEAEMGDNPIVTVKELCWHKAGQDCHKCINNCPVRAITNNGVDRHKCNRRLEVNRKKFAADPSLTNDIEVCAKCISGMPCSLASPINDITGMAS